ncbi:MAG: DUF2199 domain-containing protein [Hyphomicrobiales bacterium]
MGFNWFALGNGPVKTFEFRCSDCGEIHRGSPSFGYVRPMAYFTVPEDERADRVVIDDDTCVIDEDAYYIRGLLEIPIEEVEEPFSWGVWVSQSRESFERYLETYDDDQTGDGSFGWLPVSMPGYDRARPGQETEYLGCDVKWSSRGQRPLVVPHETDHPLYRDIVNGITWDRAVELARQVMRSDG